MNDVDKHRIIIATFVNDIPGVAEWMGAPYVKVDADGDFVLRFEERGEPIVIEADLAACFTCHLEHRDLAESVVKDRVLQLCAKTGPR